MEERGIPSVYVNKYYVDDELLRQRSGYVRSMLDSTAVLNRDFLRSHTTGT